MQKFVDSLEQEDNSRISDTEPSGIAAAPSVQRIHPTNNYHHEHDAILSSQLELIPDEDKIVLVVDPMKDYTSSGNEDEGDDYGTDGEADPDPDPDITENEAIMYTSPSPPLQPYALNHDGFKNLFFCQYCDTAFVEHEDCLDHEGNHDAINPHQCNFCVFSCGSRNTIIAHIKECHEPDKPFVCIQCSKKFGRRSDLKKHSIVHTGIRPFSCPVCGKNFSRNTNLTKHLRIHSGLKPHVCQQCPRSFTTRADLLRHAQVHNEVKPFQCSQCPATYSRRDKFLYHERTHLLKEQQLIQQQQELEFGGMASAVVARSSVAEPNDHVTQNANPVTSAAEDMVISLDPFNDLNANTGEEDTSSRFIAPPLPPQRRGSVRPLLLPPILPVPVPQQRPLTPPAPPPPPATQTIATKPTPQTRPPPHITEYVFQDHIQEITFPDHVTGDAVTFTANKPAKPEVIKPRNFACDSCPKRFTTQSSLQNHKNIHLGIRKHVCPECSKCFVRKRELDRHSVIHTGFKPFACQSCNKKFGRKDKLIRHQRIHLDEKSFVCTSCPMSFNRKDGLLLHMKSHAKNDEPLMMAMLTMAAAHQQQQQHQQVFQPPPPVQAPPMLPPQIQYPFYHHQSLAESQAAMQPPQPLPLPPQHFPHFLSPYIPSTFVPTAEMYLHQQQQQLFQHHQQQLQQQQDHQQVQQQHHQHVQHVQHHQHHKQQLEQQLEQQQRIQDMGLFDVKVEQPMDRDSDDDGLRHSAMGNQADFIPQSKYPDLKEESPYS